MKAELIDSISTLTPDGGEMLRRWIERHPDTSLTWLEQLHLTHLKAIEQGTIPDIRELRVSINGSMAASGIILHALGSRKSLKEDKEAIQQALRLYLGWLGIKRANLVLVNTIAQQPEVFDDPEVVHMHFRLAMDLLEAMDNELSLIAKRKAKVLTWDEQVGTLILSLCLRDGALSSAEVRRALTEIEEGRLIRSGSLWYVAGPVASDGTHYRRLYLSPLSTALALGLTPNSKSKPSTAITEALKAIGARLGVTDHKSRLSLKTVITAAAHYLRTRGAIPQHLVDYMQLTLRSDSLTESCWTRLLGKKPHPLSLGHEQALLAARRKADRVQPRDYKRPDAIKRILDAGKSETPQGKHKAVLSCIEMLRAEGIAPAHAILVDWVEWMITINHVEVSTAKGYLANLCRPLLATLESPDLNFDNPDRWEILVEDMLRDEMSHSKLINAVYKMSEYLGYRHGGSFAHKGFSDAAIVNAWVITEHEKNQAIDIIQRDHELSDPALVAQARNLIELAYYLGCRKWEILGLAFEEVQGFREPILSLRDNSIRRVKTNCSNRQVPLALAQHANFYPAWREQCTPPKGALSTDGILETIGFDLANKEPKLIRAVNKALQTAARSKEVSIHTLRHSCINRLMLSIEWPHLDIGELASLPYFQEVAADAARVRSIIVRPSTMDFLEHKTVSAIAGHLSFATTAAHYFHFYDVLRMGHLKQINQASELQDTASHVAVAGHVQRSIVATDIGQVIEHLALERPDRWIQHGDLVEEAFISSDDGRELKSKLRQVAELAVLAPEKRDAQLKGLIEDDHARAKYLAPLNERLSYVEELLTKKRQFKTKDGGILVMPKDAPAQAEINRLLERISTLAPDNQHRKQLAAVFHKLLLALAPNAPGVYQFDSIDEAETSLRPLAEVLGPDPIHFEAWYLCSRRKDGKIIKEKLATQEVLSCLDIKPLHKGKLQVRLSGVASTGNSRERIMKWLLASIFSAYGSLTVT